MTFDRDPPRLRTLGRELPNDLMLALADTESEMPAPAELASVSQRIRQATERDSAEKVPQFVPRPRPPRARAMALVVAFACGAGAGVVVSGGIFVVSRSSSPDPAATSAPAAPIERTPAPGTVPAPKGGAAPEVVPDETTPAVPAAPDPLRSSAREPAADPEHAEPAPSARGDRDELALVARAQSALTDNPVLALALASDHARKFPQGALVQEREVIAIDALLRLGRRVEATGRATRFHQEFPGSVHGRRVDVLIGSGSAGPGHN